MTYNQPNRWVVLALFGAVVGVNQMMVLNFAPLVTTLQQLYGVSDFFAGLPTLLNPVTYLIFGFHAGSALDHHGYKKVVGIATLVMTLAAFARSFELGYWGLLSAQVFIATSGVYITSAIAKVVSDWFPSENIGIATGAVMAGLLIGTGIGMGATALFVSELGLQTTMFYYALASLLFSVLFLAMCRENKHSLLNTSENSSQEIMSLLKDRKLFIVFCLSFLLVGATNGFNAWFEKILSLNGFSPEQAGYVVGLALLCSIVSAAIIPALSDRMGRRKPFLLLSCVFGIVFTYPMLSSTDLGTVLGLGAMAGTLQLPSYILIIALSAEYAGPARAGMANSLVMITNSAGGLLIALLMERVGGWFGWQYASLVLVATAMIGLWVSNQLNEQEAPKHSFG